MEISSATINQNKRINLQKLAKDKKARSFAWLSMTIFAISFFSVVAIRPTLVTIAKLTREIKDKKEANKQLEDKINTLIAAQDEYVKNSDNIFLLDQSLPKKSEFPLFAFSLEQLASGSGIEIKSFSFEKIFITKNTNAKLANQAYSILGFSLTASGDYFKLKDFISKLETSRRIIKVDGVSFKQAKKKTTQASELPSSEIVISVSGKAFFEKN